MPNISPSSINTSQLTLASSLLSSLRLREFSFMSEATGGLVWKRFSLIAEISLPWHAGGPHELGVSLAYTSQVAYHHCWAHRHLHVSFLVESTEVLINFFSNLRPVYSVLFGVLTRPVESTPVKRHLWFLKLVICSTRPLFSFLAACQSSPNDTLLLSAITRSPFKSNDCRRARSLFADFVERTRA